MQRRQWLVFIGLSPPEFGFSLKFGRCNHIQQRIFGLHKPINLTDADRIKLLDGCLVILMIFPMVLFIIIHEKRVKALAEGEVFR